MSKRQLEFVQFQDYLANMYPESHVLDHIDSRGRGVSNVAARSVTFQVTDACNLACSYCYQTNKGNRKMSFETAKQAVDLLLSGEKGIAKYLNSFGIILDFIGGEPFLEIELIDKIVDYFRYKAIEMNHPWADKFKISLCTNGVLYFTPEVQQFLIKNRNLLSFSITVDGTKDLHDACRRFPDGRPSYDLAHAAAMDYMSRGGELGSKITISPYNINFLSECLIQMVEDGYNNIHANCVFEEGWTIDHARILYQQCKSFIDTFMKDHNPLEYEFSLFNNMLCSPKMESDIDNWCGGNGGMLAIDPDGKLYPCIRYMESSLGNKREPLVIGDVWNGLGATTCQQNCIDCINKVTRRSQSTDECFYCPIAGGCAWCSAYNYQVTGTVDKRVTYICEMHKAQVLATVYYWNKFYKEYLIDKVVDLWVPKSWAIPIIGEEEYDDLVSLTEELGGFVNIDGVQVRVQDFAIHVNKENFENIEIMKRG